MDIEKVGFNFFNKLSEIMNTTNDNDIKPVQQSKDYGILKMSNTDEESEIDETQKAEKTSATEKEKPEEKTTGRTNNTAKTISDLETATKVSQIDSQLSSIFKKIETAKRNEDSAAIAYYTKEYNKLLAERQALAGKESSKKNQTSQTGYTTTTSEITAIEKEIAEIQAKKETAMKLDDKEKQYKLEQEENSLYAKRKELLIEQYRKDRNNNVSAEELSLYSTYLDFELSETRLKEKISYLEEEAKNIQKELEIAYNNEDMTQANVLEQQLNALNALQCIFEKDILNLDKSKSEREYYLDMLNTEPVKSNSSSSKTELQSTIAKLEDIRMNAITLASNKSTALQNEDKEALYILEQQENELMDAEKKLKIEAEKLAAKIQGTELSASEIDILEKEIDLTNKALKIESSIQMNDYMKIQISTAKATAIQNGDKEKAYTLEQQEAALQANIEMLKINKANTEQDQKTLKESYNILRNSDLNATDKKKLETIIENHAKILEEKFDIQAKKNTAMQTEDNEAQYKLEQEENTLWEKEKNLIIEREKLIAKSQGKTLSTTEIETLEKKIDFENKSSRIQEKRIYFAYKISQIAASKSIAMQNEDNVALYTLEQQENALNALDKIFEINETNIIKQKEFLEEAYNTLKNSNLSASDKKSLETIINKQADIIEEEYELKSQKSMAMQNEDNATLEQIETKEKELNDKKIETEIEKAKLLAKAEGKTLTTSEINQMTAKLQAEYQKNRITDLRQLISYKTITLATAQTTAIQNDDKESQYLIDIQEDELSKQDKELEKRQQELERALKSGSSTALNSAITRAADGSVTINTIAATNTTNTTNTTNNTNTENNTNNTTNDGTFMFVKKVLYRNGEKYTGEFEGKQYKKGKLLTGKLNDLYYKKGELFTGKKGGKMYENGALISGIQDDGFYYYEGKKLSGLVTFTPFKEDGKTLDESKAEYTYYKNGVPATGKFQGKLYVDGELFTGTYKNKEYVDGIRQK